MKATDSSRFSFSNFEIFFRKGKNKISFIFRKTIYKISTVFAIKKCKHEKIKVKGEMVPVVVSLTSFEPRFKTLHLVLKSLINQKMKPEKIVLYLDETVEMNSIPDKIRALEKYGVEIKNSCEDFKGHKKYYYALQDYPDKCVVTVDDDVIYSKNLIKKLYSSYEKFPDCISAMRTHLVTYDDDGNRKFYNEWKWNYKKILEPSFKLFPTGVGGVLYPPSIMPEETFNSKVFTDLCLKADDVWLKFNELKKGIKTVHVPSLLPSYYLTEASDINNLNSSNVSQGKNNEYIDNCEKYFSLKL